MYKSLEDFSAKRMLNFCHSKKSDFWNKTAVKTSLNLFHLASKKVPAYKDFLKKNGINPEKIKNWEDFQKVPPVDKKNYLRQYDIKDLCWEGSFQNNLVFTSTSGSTGEPFYFPRSSQMDWQSSIFHELFLQYGDAKKNGPVLIIVAFGMGVWIGGLLTYKAFEICGRRGDYPVSILTPGINKKEIFSALKNLAPQYKQTIIVGYPPFVKDILDESELHQIDIKKLNLRFVFAAETFTENFRDYLVKKTGMNSCLKDVFHVYGSADLGTMAVEMPASILIKRLALKNEKLFADVFSCASKVPTLAQFNPAFVNFESVNGELFLTGNNILPLIRYSIGDRGGVFTFSEIEEKFLKYGINLTEEAKKADIAECFFKLPFVYIYERTDLSTTLYGINIYPQYVKDALLHESLNDLLTGKFTMSTEFDEEHNQYLEIHLELKKNLKTEEIDIVIENKVLDKVVEHLLSKSSEFRELKHHLGERAHPKLKFHEAEHPVYFKPGVKQSWVKK